MLSKFWKWLVGKRVESHQGSAEYARPATWEDVNHVVRLLCEHEVSLRTKLTPIYCGESSLRWMILKTVIERPEPYCAER